MPVITALTIITAAHGTLNTYQPGETVSNADVQDSLTRLNWLVSAWSQQGLTIPAIARLVFPLINNKGSSTNPYTVGLTGDLVMPRPANQNSITGAGLLLNASSPPVELPRPMLTDDGWAGTRIKDLTSTLFTSAYYQPTFASDLGSLYLWPVPTDLTNSLVLYPELALSSFASLTTQYNVPPSCEEALSYNLSERLSTPYGRPFTAMINGVNAATYSLGIFKRSNYRLSDLPSDAAMLTARTGSGGHGWNILTGE